MLTLYFDPLSISSQKVLLVLAELMLEWRGEHVDLLSGAQHQPAYRAINPRAEVPALIDDRWVVTESSVICEYLSDITVGSSLCAKEPRRKAEMRFWVYRVAAQLQTPCGFLTYAIVARPLQLMQPRAEVLAIIDKIPDPTIRRSRLACFEQGVASPEFDESIEKHRQLFCEVDRLLANQAWLGGAAYSLADAELTPYLVRIEHLGLQNLFAELPNLTRWYAACRSRPSFTTAITNVIPPEFIAISKQAGEMAMGAR